MSLFLDLRTTRLVWIVDQTQTSPYFRHLHVQVPHVYPSDLDRAIVTFLQSVPTPFLQQRSSRFRLTFPLFPSDRRVFDSLPSS